MEWEERLPFRLRRVDRCALSISFSITMCNSEFTITLAGVVVLLLCYSGPDPAPPTTLSRVAPTPHITRPKVTYSVQDLNQWDGFQLLTPRAAPVDHTYTTGDSRGDRHTLLAE